MVKIRVPYSGLVAGTAMIFGASILTTALIGIIIELLIGGILYTKMSSSEGFYYDSIYGQLATQYIIFPVFGAASILNIIMARVAAFAFLFLNMPYHILSIILFTATVIHYVPADKQKSPD